MKQSRQVIITLMVLLLAAAVLSAPVAAANYNTTELRIAKYANDKLTVLNETTVDYHWLEANLPIQGDGVTRYWYTILQPYVNNTTLQICPSRQTINPGYGWNWYCSYAPGTQYSPPRTGPRYEGVNLSVLKSPGPAGTILIADNWTGGTTSQRVWLYMPVNQRDARHNGGDNYGFADGHAKWLKTPKSLYSYGSMPPGYTL